MRGASKASLATIVALLLVSSARGHGEPERPSVTLTGEVVDLTCYVAHGVRGSDNAFCAEHSTQVAQPVALLTDDGAVYLLAADHDNRFGYEHIRTLVGERARVEGVASERNGVKLLEVKRASRRKSKETS